jgi:hypothetical protein
MDSRKHAIVDGPDKPALQRSLTRSDDDFVHFRVKDDAFDAQIMRMDEGADGFTFELQGRVASGELKDEPFDAIYSIETRSGWIRFNAAADQKG